MKNLTTHLFCVIGLVATVFNSNAQSPGGVSLGLHNWYRADAGTSLSYDGAPVLTWSDSGPYGLDGTQTYFWNSPFYTADAFNFHPALRFYGDWSWLNADLAVLSTGEYTVFVVSERSTNQDKGYYLGIEQAAPRGFHMGYLNDNLLLTKQFDNVTSAPTNAYTASSETPLIHRTHRFSSGLMEAAMFNGSNMVTDSDNNPGGTPEFGAGRIGKGYDNNGFNGLIAEVIVYNRVLSDVELVAVESYLSLKYGTTIPTSRNLYFANSGYNNNVQGLARDDAKALNNPKSQSEEIDGLITLEAEGIMPDNTRLIIGHNGLSTNLLAGGTGSVTAVMERAWYVEELNELGTISLSLETSNLGIADLSSLKLLIDDEGDGFDDELPISGTVNGSQMVFSGIDLEDGYYFTFASAQTTYYAMASGNITDQIWKTSPSAASFVFANFDEAIDMIITSSVTVTNDVPGLTVKNIKIDPTATLVVNDNDEVHIHGQLEVDGTLQNGNSHFYFEGGVRNIILGSSELSFYNMTSDNSAGLRLETTTHVRNVLYVLQDYFNTNDFLVLDSDATSSGMIAPLVGANLVGNVTFNRHHTAALNGYVMCGSPIRNMTVSDFNDDIITTGFPGSDYPGYAFNNIKLYDESITGIQDDGFYGVNSLSDPINPGEGTMIYMAAGTHQIDLYGRIEKGNIDLPVTYTDHGMPSADGWSLVANPYPCTINWDSGSWTKTNIDDAIYVYDAANQVYMTYINGIGNNGGSQNIAPGQAFWVKANAPLPMLRAREMVKEPIQSNFKNGNENAVLQLSFSAEDRTEQFSVYWNDDATTGFDPAYDAKYIPANNNVHGIGIYDTDGNVLSISAIPELEESTQLPLHVNVPISGTFTFEVTGVDTFGNGRCLRLVDTALDTSYPLQDGEMLQMDIQAGNYTNRFFLAISQNVIGTTSDITCFGMQNGEAFAQLSGQSNVFWYNDNEELFQQDLNTNEASARSLKPGSYSIEVQGIEGCPSVFGSFQIFEPSQINAQANTLNPTCPYSTDGFIEINSYGGTGLHTYQWEHGTEGPLLMELSPGEYTVEIKDESNCVQLVSVALQAEDNAVPHFSTDLEYYVLQDNQVTVNFINQTEHYDTCTWDFGDGNTSTEFSPTHTYTSPGEYLVILTVTSGLCSFQTSAKIVVESASTIDSSTIDTGIDIGVSESNLIITGYFDQPKTFEVRIYNVIGQLLVPVKPVQIGNETIQIPLNIKPQQILVEILDTSLGEHQSVRLTW